VNTLEVKTREERRTWLAEHHATEKEVWLVVHDKHTGIANVPRDETVEGALCSGWTDSLIKRLDDDTYAGKHTARGQKRGNDEREKRSANSDVANARD